MAGHLENDGEYLEIEGQQFELDLLDADTMERYQNALDRANDQMCDINASTEMTVAENMRRQCRILDEFFNSLFGDGTAASLFGLNNNLGKRLAALGETVTYANESQARAEELAGKYNTQRLNREQRRTQQFQANRQRTSAAPAQRNQPVRRSGNALPGNVSLTPEQIAQIAAIINGGAQG